MRNIYLGMALSLMLLSSAQAKPMHQPGSPAGLSNESAGGSAMPHSEPHSGPRPHSKLEIPAGQPVPAIALEVLPDRTGGWALHTKLTNFKFAPETVDQNSLATEGHAHLYINGKKVTRLYSSWYYLGKLPAGPQRITVTLNTNRHEDLFYKGKRIEATQGIIVFPTGTMPHGKER